MIPYWLLPYRPRLWLQLCARRLREALRGGSGEAWRRFGSTLRAHPWSAAVRGGGGGAGAELRLAIMMTPCCWDDFVVPIVQLGAALERRGMQVSWIGGNAGICAFFGSAGEGWTDASCVRRFEMVDRRILGRTGRFETLNARVTPQVRDEARRWTEAHAGAPLLELTFEGHGVWEFIKSALARRTGTPPDPRPTDTLVDIPGAKALVEGFVINARVLAGWLDQARPDAILIFSGYHYQERLAAELARGRGIRVVAHENSCFADRRIFDVSGMIGNRTSVARATWPEALRRPLGPAEERRLDAYLDGIWRGRVNKIGQGGASDPAAIRLALGLDPARPLALLLGQVPVDTVMLHDVPAFPTSLAFLRRVIEIFGALPDWDLVVRLHPLEADAYGDATWRALAEAALPSNVHLVHAREANTYALMDMAALGITATSQTGLEMVAKDKTVVVAGDAFYAGKGFTLDAPSGEALSRVLREATARPERLGLDAERRRLARRFLYHVIFEHQVPYDPLNGIFPPEAVDRIEAMIRRGEAVRWQCGHAAESTT